MPHRENPYARIVEVCESGGAVLAVGLLVFTVKSWKDGYWSTLGRLHYTLVTAATLAFTWFVNHWNLLGFQL